MQGKAKFRIGPVLEVRDWVYLLSLLIPLVDYNLMLKFVRVSDQSGGFGFLETLALVRSDLLFNLGYAVLWVGLFAVARRGPLRSAVVLLFHVATVLVALITTGAHLYFQETGSTLDYSIIVYSVTQLGEIRDVITSVASPGVWFLLLIVLVYVTLGPWLATRAFARWRGLPASGEPSGAFPLISLGASLVAFALISLSATTASAQGESTSFARDPVVNVVATEVKQARIQASIKNASKNAATENPPTDTSLTQTSGTRKRNVVFIHLESARARSVTPYNEDIKTTPYLDELAEHSLVADRAYAIVPHTSKAIVSVNCGIEPHIDREITEAEPGGIPARCLPELLRDQGYNSVFFQSATEKFEDRRDIVKNFGYQDFYPLESMDTEGFQKVNYFGYEDDIMLDPSKKWLEDHRGEPFVATYLGVTGHHDYLPVDRYGYENFSQDELLNRYQNEVHYLDSYVKNVIEQYKEMGLYENTIFVIYGDHGEGFGEHDLYQHDNTIYEEGLRIPLIIHDPGRFENGKRVETLTSELDILPTVLDLLEYKVSGGKYPGRSMLAAPDPDRTLYFSCYYDYRCLASMKGDQKYIYFFGNQPEEVYDLSSDPLEQHNIAGEQSPEEMKKRRSEVLDWYTKVNSMYQRHTK